MNTIQFWIASAWKGSPIWFEKPYLSYWVYICVLLKKIKGVTHMRVADSTLNMDFIDFLILQDANEIKKIGTWHGALV